MAEYVKYPRIPHIKGSRGTPDDWYTDDYPSGEFQVFEKMDGTNSGISMDRGSHLLFQNRGGYLENKRPHPQWDALKNWAFAHYIDFLEIFITWPNNKGDIVFGEWLYAQHATPYTDLPSHFFVIDYWSAQDGWCKSYHELQKRVGKHLHITPVIGYTSNIQSFIKETKMESPYTQSPEGYIFRDLKDYSRMFKYVRPNFISGQEHWFNRELTVNKLK